MPFNQDTDLKGIVVYSAYSLLCVICSVYVLFPLNSCWWFRADVINDSIYSFNFIDNSI